MKRRRFRRGRKRIETMKNSSNPSLIKISILFNAETNPEAFVSAGGGIYFLVETIVNKEKIPRTSKRTVKTPAKQTLLDRWLS